MRLAGLTGLYVGVVCSAQIGAQKIVELLWTGEAASGGAVLIGVALALILLVAFGSLEFLAGQIQAKVAGTLLLGLPLVLVIRRAFERPVAVPAT